MSFDPRLLDKILVCTKCHAPLVHAGESLMCVGPECRLQFAIAHEIPNMLLEESTAAVHTDWSAAMQRAGRDPVSGVKP